MKFSCNTTPICSLKSWGLIRAMSIPSTVIFPLWGIYNLCISFDIVLLPDPLRPTRPYILFSFNSNDIPWSTSLPSILYLKRTLLNAMRPLISGNFSIPCFDWASLGELNISPIRSTDNLACWYSCQSWTSLSTGPLTLPESILNATSCPILNFWSMTSFAPTERIRRSSICWMKFAITLDVWPIIAVLYPALT